ncbi:MAG TPA: hypothetical protein VIS52_03990 [Motiliproteus sp.]
MLVELLTLPLWLLGSVLLLWPWAGWLPTLLLLWLFRRRRRVIQLLAALLWGLYTLYELAIYYRLTCSGECNIRVDLLLIYPVLLLATLLALLAARRFSPDTSI